MEREDKILVALFLVSFLALALLIRLSMPNFMPVIVESRLFFQLLLAASVIALLRNCVGISTYGVFGPAIIAFGLLSPGPLWGVALYVNVLVLALAVRFIIEPLRIPNAYRVALLISVFGIFVSLAEVVGELYHMSILQASLLFPALITSWMADRFANNVREIGWREPAIKLLATFLLVLVSWAVISNIPLVIWFIENPEMWAILIGFNILLATKWRFRLLEYLRFDWVLRKQPPSDVLSMNVRNREYIEEYNPRHLFPGLEKAEMKKAMHGLGISTPETYLILSEKRQLGRLRELLTGRDKFVIKPNVSYGGEGIIVVTGKKGGRYASASGKTYGIQELTGHAAQIMDGQYSSELWDSAIVEALVVAHPFFSGISSGGVPDIRVIVFKGFPLMAMTRLPTRESGGEANLHKGAVGVGLELHTGKAVTAFSNKLGHIKKHPDTGAPLEGVVMPGWRGILELAVKAHYASRLGYSGVDIVVDKDKGPMVLEVNKRPGLGIQNANLEGLLRRLRFVEGKLAEVEHLPLEKKVDLVMEWSEKGWR
ncbi:MAG: sugar-transfer associated ATP-grasp domain-containing protein [Candidatus Micrarchaeota archaeon]